MSGVLRTVGKVAGIVATVAMLTGHPEIALIAAAVAAPASIGSHIPESPMTAINIFDDGRRAYIATDGAAYYPDTGRIAALGSKTVMFPTISMAVAVAGSVGAGEVTAALDRVCNRGEQHAMLRAMPAALSDLKARYLSGAAPGLDSVRLWIATYDRVRAKPRLYAIATDFDPTAPDAEPMKLREIRGWTTGLTPAQLATVLPSGHITDPRADACRLLSAQRHYPFPYMGGRCGVAGTCEFFTISRRGVTGERILRFPESVGDLPDPAVPGEVMC